MLEQASCQAGRYSDVAVCFVEHERDGPSGQTRPTGRHSPIYGGRLDAWSGSYAGDAEDVLAVPVSKPQLDLVIADTSSVLAYGGRGGGKSMYARSAGLRLSLEMPGRMGVCVAPTHKKCRILFNKLLSVIPREWLYKVQRAPQDRQIWLINGTKIVFFSADNPDAIRGEDGAWALIDESQDVCDEAIANALLCLRVTDQPRIVEVGTPKARTDFEDRFNMLSEDDTATVQGFGSRENPFISTKVFDIAKKRLSPALYAQEVEAKWVADGKFVYQFYDKSVHAKPFAGRKKLLEGLYPNAKRIGEDITGATLKRRLNLEAEYLVGMDFNFEPMTAVVFRILRGPRPDASIAWAVKEIVLGERSDATRLGRELIDRGYGDCAIVADASDARAKSYYRALRNLGLSVFRPAKNKANPAVVDRRNAVNSKLMNADNEVSLYIDPEGCPKLKVAMAKHELNDKGRPLDDKYSHLCSALGYAVVKLYPVTGGPLVSGI